MALKLRALDKVYTQLRKRASHSQGFSDERVRPRRHPAKEVSQDSLYAYSLDQACFTCV